jgi:glycosyltransferase involved in cell wall biosynthesis
MKIPSQIFFLSWEDLSYSRTGVIFNGLIHFGHNCEVIRVPRGKYLGIVKIIRNVKRSAPNGSVVVVGSPCSILTILCRVFWIRSKIICDSGWPLIDGLISRKFSKSKSFLDYLKLYFIDFIAYKLANLVAFESNMQRRICTKKFLIPYSKSFVSYTGFNETLYREGSSEQSVAAPHSNQVIFRGKYNLESGLEILAQASWYLQSNINLIVISPNVPKTVRFSPSVEIISKRISDSDLVQYYKTSALSLGQLGGSPRIERTIPHKFYEAIFFGTPYLTEFSSAISELITTSDCFVYSKEGSPQDLAVQISSILSNKSTQKAVSDSARTKYSQNFSQATIVKNYLVHLEAI